MKLIKISSLAALLLLVSYTANAQSYINVGIGYGAPALRELVAVDYHSTSNTTYTGVYSSYGAGLQPELTFGYKFNPNFGMEFGYGYLFGSKIVSDIHDEQGPNTETGTNESWARMHRVMIGARVTASEGAWQPYMRVGMSVGMGGTVFSETETTTTGPSFNSSFHRVDEYSGGVAVGFTGGLGIHYHISDMFAIYGEANMIAQNYSPKRGLITTYDVDGQDQLGSMTIRDKETEYVDEYTTVNPPNDGQPDQDLKFYLPMSSIGVTVGMHFYFGGH